MRLAKLSLQFAFVMLVLALASEMYAQKLRLKQALFSTANQAMKKAREVQADILAPKSFGEGLDLYRKATADFGKGKSLNDIRKNLKTATDKFEKAIEATKLANVAFGTAIKARSDAQSAEAPTVARQLWQNAETNFSAATRALETGDMKDAKKKAKDAEKLYRDAELKAIKISYLDETYTLLKQAEQLKIKDFAPKTLKNAQDLVKAAEQELQNNRYDTDQARILARQALREAKHALYLGQTIRNKRDQRQAWEDLMLEAEQPLVRISRTIDHVATFEQGTKEPTDVIVKRIKEFQKNVAQLNADLFDANHMVTLLQQRAQELEQQVGEVEAAKSALAKRLQRQAHIRSLYDEVEKLFTGEVAVFIREGNDVIIRTVGLSFPVGKATIEPKYYEFLARVAKAIRVFDRRTVTIEGHTDSYGSDETNWNLSIDRAQAVKQYLVANEALPADQIEAIGYGESRPIATNETQEGRARNRRIEVIIHPVFEEEGT